jgi:uncharacterized protein (TIGR02646 family)
MNKIGRTPAPGWLEEKYKEWGKEWKKKYDETGKSSKFRWRQYKNKGYGDLVEKLSEMTKNHCSFCDAYPMGRRIPYTIEHFRPKTGFPLLAYKWDNLFPCCGLCQQKGDDFDEKLLKPDDDAYSFDEYFVINWDTGELEPNKGKKIENQVRAEITIKLYRLNENGKPEDRLAELEDFKELNNPDIDEHSYRFFIQRDS